jgi:hypothetical protein
VIVTEVIKIVMLVLSPKGQHTFELLAHKAERRSKLRLPLEFYNGTIESFPQWEAEIIRPVVPRGETGKLNYHYSPKDNLPYMCYPGHLPDRDTLVQKARIWAIGQVCIMDYDRYLNEMISEAGGIHLFETWAENSCGVRLISVTLS